MKFKYHLLETKLWKLDREYSYEVNENNHLHTQKGTFGSDGWILGKDEQIIFTFFYSRLKVYYQKKNFAYQKTLDLPSNGEIVFEFTEQDLISHEK